MSAVKTNPFHKPNPFKHGNFQRFHHPHISSSNLHSFSHLENQSSYVSKQSRVGENTWNFNENNLNKRLDFTKKYDSIAQASNFQMRMKISSVYVPPNSQSKVIEIRPEKMDNPFFRKNLLINKSEVANQVEMDINLYRNKASSYHEGRMSFGSSNPSESPYILKKRESRTDRDILKPVVEVIQSRYIDGNSAQNNESLGYSKTPRDTLRVKEEEEKEDFGPAIIEFRKKKFYFTPMSEVE